MAPTPSPALRLPPIEVARETFVLRSVHPVAGAPLTVACNTLVVRGEQPVVIDVGTRQAGAGWLSDLTSLLDPATVRWIVLTHDDARHRGPLAEVLPHCPRATVVTSWAASLRSTGETEVPLGRMRWVDDGDLLDVGDRRLHVLRPPVYDSPAARAVFDPATGVLWACDAFAVPMPLTGVDRVDELAPTLWVEGMAMLAHHALAPWLATVDRAAHRTAVRRLRELAPSVVVSAHSPVIAGPSLESAFEHLAALPDLVPPPHPHAWSGGPSPASPIATDVPPVPGTRPVADTDPEEEHDDHP